MKCYICGQKTDYLTSDDNYICISCAESKNYILCTDTGRYIADSLFECDHICNDCVFKDE